MKIYVLIDPRDNSVRYVGVTKGDLLRRSYKHVTSRRENTPRGRWLAELYEHGFRPIIREIDNVSDDAWPEAERRWISHYRENGHNLVNSAIGGPGFQGNCHTDEAKAKISAAKLGKPINFANPTERAAKISASRKGMAPSKETRAKLSIALRGRSILPPEAGREARLLIASGLSIRKVAQQIGFSKDVVGRFLKRDLVSGTGRELTIDELTP